MLLFCIPWGFKKNPKSLLMILDDSKGYTFVFHTMIFAVNNCSGLHWAWKGKQMIILCENNENIPKSTCGQGP